MASFRLAVLGTLFSVVGAVIVFALIYVATGLAAHQELAPIVAGDREDILSDAVSDQLSVAREIQLTIKQGVGHTFYALAGKGGNIIVASMPMPDHPGTWHSITRLQDPSMPAGVSRIDGIGTPLADGDMLFIGEDASVFAALNRHIAVIFAIVFGAMIGLGLLASMTIASYSLKRVRAISDASADIMTGDLSRRIESYGIDDELDVLTKDLNNVLDMLERLVENARQVTNDIAHDLRAPLARLQERLQRIARRAEARHDAQLRAELEAALAQTDIVISMFAALLRLAEVEAGAMQGGFTVLDLGALVRAVGEEFVDVAADEGQVFTVEAPSPLWVRGDHALLVQMLVNLIENAIRHCPPGTAMHLSLSLTSDGLARIEMADSGRGIPEAERERVFQRFVRLDSSRHSVGHGLGLPLIRAIITMHDGTVALLDNHPGLRVRAELPALARFNPGPG